MIFDLLRAAGAFKKSWSLSDLLASLDIPRFDRYLQNRKPSSSHLMRQPYKGLFSGDLSNSGYGRKGFSPSSPKRALLPLSPKRTQVRLGSLKITALSCLAHARSTPNPRTSFGALDLRLICCLRRSRRCHPPSQPADRWWSDPFATDLGRFPALCRDRD